MSRHEGGITWLASYPKSGNTWVRMFLACYQNDGNPVNINAIPRNLTYADHRDQDYHCVAPCVIEKLSQYEVLMLRGAVLLKLMHDTTLRPLLIKTHNANGRLDGIKLIPDQVTSSAIYIVRDPRDVAVSFSHWTKTPIDDVISTMADERTVLPNLHKEASSIMHYIGNWSMHVTSWMSTEFDTLVVRYESLCTDPQRAFSDILEGIGWEVDDERVARSVRQASFDSLKANEDRHGFVEKPGCVESFFRNGKAGGWVGYLTRDQSDRICSDHGEMMEKLGYLDHENNLVDCRVVA